MALTWPHDFIDKVICGDCTKILPLIPDGGIDAVITDPPYGINIVGGNGRIGGDNLAQCKIYSKVYGDDKPFNPKPILRFHDKPMFLFGGNYFCHALPQTSSWIIWDKREGGTSDNQADCELIWSNVGGPARLYSHKWRGMIKASERREPRQHPTQKPVALMRWIISNWTKPGDIILDPYAGSGTTLVACKELDRRFIGIEISPKYCRIAEDRLSQGELFNIGVTHDER